MLGAYTRLTNAGLGCPDWPGCYGRLILPSTASELNDAQHHYPEIPIESQKAWTEMAHRYVAGTLGVLIFIIGGSVLFFSRGPAPKTVPLLLTLLVIFQAMLGMWTVTLKLLPAVVMAHLLGGIILFSGLCYFRLQLSDAITENRPETRFWITLGIVIVFCQLALGGWVSSNYAGVACIGFPQCNGHWLPELHFSKGFNIVLPVGANYQGGVMDNSVRVTIQWVHRLGALITAVYVLMLSLLLLLKVKLKGLRQAASLALILLIVQLLLGIFNVTYLLPLWVAVGHNGAAALLFATLLVMRFFAAGGSTNVR
jgi:cytochrome c oxidase assembly protein subunit 15